MQSKPQTIPKSGNYQSSLGRNSLQGRKTSKNKRMSSLLNNCVETSQVQTNFKNSNNPLQKDTESKDFMDQELTSLVESLVEKVVSKGPNEKMSRQKKLHTKPTLIVGKSLNSSLVSTTASDDSNSCERSSILSSKDARSDSISSNNIAKDVNSSVNSKQLFEIPERAPTDFVELMRKNSRSPDGQYGGNYSQVIDPEDPNMSCKKPVPNKYKTEICRNWQQESFCRFGDECTFAHGSYELNKKGSMPSNYKTKVCIQFTEEPHYCPYGEKCQFLHISCNKDEKTSNRQPSYSEILIETIKQFEMRNTHLEDFESFEIPSDIFNKPRLSVFRDMTDIEENDEESQPNSSNNSILKKTALSKKSRVFVMPQKKTLEYSASYPDLATCETT